MRSALIAVTSLALAGCSSAPMHIDAGNRPTAAVSVIDADRERIAFELTEASYVAAVEVVSGRGLRALLPSDSSGTLPAGSHDVSFRAVGTLRQPGQARAVAGQRFDFFGGCPGGAVVYEPVQENLAASSGIESPKASPQVNLRSVPQLCEKRQVRVPDVDGTFRLGDGPSTSRWVIVLASDHPIDAGQLLENLTSVRSTRYSLNALSQIASIAMAGHEGTWSADAARR